MTKPVIAVHGGAGEWPRRKHRLAIVGVEKAATRGFKLLQEGGSAKDAVEAAVTSMEDNPLFNAGTGSALNLAGNIETDAAMMDGSSLQAGAVALVSGVRNPIRLARIVMERTDHVLIAGPATGELADAYGIPRANLRVRERIEAWRQGRRAFEKGKLENLVNNYQLFKSGHFGDASDTVGAVALDQSGSVAAGCSTGGLFLKLPGRIGDSAIVGAGLYADNAVGAATATGIGELAMRLTVSKVACDMMKDFSAKTVAQRTIRMVGRRIGRGLGMIALDRYGRFGVAHSTRNLCWAMIKRGDTSAGMSGSRV